MSKRDVGFLALGRFLAVERYCQSSQPGSTHPIPGPRPPRTGRRADAPDLRLGSWHGESESRPG